MIKNFEILNNSVNHSILNNNNNNIDNSILFSNDYLSEHNFSSNYLKYSDYYILVNKFYDTSKWLNVSLITLITLFGFYGNIVSILVFSHRSYKNVPLRACFILISIADVLVLLLHYLDFTFRSWVNLLGIYDSKFNFVDKCLLCCKMIPYFRNVFRTISVYILLLMTVQRNVQLYFPLYRSKWFCSNKFIKKRLVFIIVLSLLINLNNPYLNSLVQHKQSGEMYCSVDSEHVSLQFKIDLLFVLVTILIPILLILILSFVLLTKIKSNAPNYYFQFCLCKRNSTSLIDLNGPSMNQKEHSTMKMTLINGTNLNWNGTTTLNPGNIEMPAAPPSPVRLTYKIDEEDNSVLLTKSIRPIFRFKRENTKRKSLKSQSSYQFVRTADGNNIKLFKNSNSCKSNHNNNSYKNVGHSVRTTYMLVLLSKWFVILHLPYFICWILFHFQMSNPTITDFNPFKNVNSSEIFNDYESILLNHTLNINNHDNMNNSFFNQLIMSENENFNSTSILHLNKTIFKNTDQIVDYHNQSNHTFGSSLSYISFLKTRTLRGLLNIFEILFLFNYSINFLLYTINGNMFKRVYKKAILDKINFRLFK